MSLIAENHKLFIKSVYSTHCEVVIHKLTDLILGGFLILFVVCRDINQKWSRRKYLIDAKMQRLRERRNLGLDGEKAGK